MNEEIDLSEVNFLVDDVDGIVAEIVKLISRYKKQMQYHESKGDRNMCISFKGSMVGLVALLSAITDKPACDYFNELGSFGEKE